MSIEEGKDGQQEYTTAAQNDPDEQNAKVHVACSQDLVKQLFHAPTFARSGIRNSLNVQT